MTQTPVKFHYTANTLTNTHLQPETYIYNWLNFLPPGAVCIFNGLLLRDNYLSCQLIVSRSTDSLVATIYTT